MLKPSHPVATPQANRGPPIRSLKSAGEGGEEGGPYSNSAATPLDTWTPPRVSVPLREMRNPSTEDSGKPQAQSLGFAVRPDLHSEK